MHAVLLTMLSLAATGLAPQQDPKETRPVNRLADATSPYLRQHAHNPVDWYPWGEAAIARAKAEDKPIFLSIGYAACHWCHVMERESFEDPAIAKLMNQYFVNVKVDREERPDLDEIYMAAVQGMTGHGGWPMSVWLTPDLEPFFAGTYFPPQEGRGMPAFPRVLEHVHRIWTERRDLVVEQSAKVAQHIREQLAPTADPADPSLAHVALLVEQSASRFDAEFGGFGQPGAFAPKFPHASELQVLLRHHARTGDEHALKMAAQTLIAMAHGGIYDQLGGGFHRYSVDREWLVPHFEKMLYDNALLAQVYTEAYLLTGETTFERVTRETLDYLVREMQDPAGGFWSTTDADSEGVEGKFFVWDHAEVVELLGDDAAAFNLRYGVQPGGNWEGSTVLHVSLPIEAVAERLDITPAEANERIERGREKLLAHRASRVPPGTDDKVLAAWNGMAIAALAEGYQAFGDERWLRAAQRAARFVLDEMRAGDDGRLHRSWRQGDARLQGYLEDHAYVADALLRLFESDFDPQWLAAAQGLLAAIDEHFLDESDGSFFFTADDHERLIARTKAVTESSIPSGIAITVLAHLRGSLLLGDPELWERGLRAVRANHAMLSSYPVAAPGLVLGAQLALADPVEVVVAGAPDAESTRAMLHRVRRAYPPHHVVALVHDGNREALAELTPIVAGKEPAASGAAAYVCRRGACEAPVTDPGALELHRAQRAR